METREEVIRVRGLTRRFGAFTAVDRVDFEVYKGEIFGYLGANGAGKSTTIRMLCGLLSPTSGEALVAGIDVGRHPERVKRAIGYMSQKFSLYADLTVEENVEFFGGAYGIGGARLRRRGAQVLEAVGLDKERGTKAGDLPGGWRQRLALGCAILHEPRIVFLDEPTAGVDPLSRRDFWALIRGLARGGTTILVTTHYMEESEYCDRLAIIHRGEIVALGAPADLKAGRMHEAVLEIECERPAEAMAVVERQPGIREAALFGAGLHAVTPPDPAAPEALRHALEAAGFRVSRVERIMPTMEDVFVSLVESRERAGGALEEVRR